MILCANAVIAQFIGAEQLSKTISAMWQARPSDMTKLNRDALFHLKALQRHKIAHCIGKSADGANSR